MSDNEFPSRYEPLARLGQGGGGEVWSVRDRFTRREYALKLLGREAGPRELAALVREAVALSGLEASACRGWCASAAAEGPATVHAARASAGEQPRRSDPRRRAAGIIDDPRFAAADQLTQLHRAGLLHGDVKPGNVIVQPDGEVTFVDLGLAAPWREGGTPAEGLTPRYAAPELFEGRPLTVRAEVYALGVAIGEILEATRAAVEAPLVARELSLIAARATAARPEERYPSVDELAVAVRSARAHGQPESRARTCSAICGDRYDVWQWQRRRARSRRRRVAVGWPTVLGA